MPSIATPTVGTARPARLARLVAACLLVGTLTATAVGCSSGDEPAANDTTTSTTANPAPTSEPSADDPSDGSSTSAPPTPPTTLPADELAVPLTDPAATGRELAQRFLDILGNPSPGPLLEEFLSPAFQLQRSNGTFANKGEYVDQPASVARFTILNDGFRAYQEGPTLTVRFRVTIEEEINGEQLRSTDADRLGVFIRTTKGWQLLAWSNFNPVAP